MRRLVILSVAIVSLSACRSHVPFSTGQSAQGIYEESISKVATSPVLGADFPSGDSIQKLRDTFEHACEQGDAKIGIDSGNELLAIQIQALGPQATDVSGTIAQMAQLDVRVNRSEEALKLVDKQLSVLGDLQRITPENAHGAYHLLVAKYKAAKVLNQPDVVKKTQEGAKFIREKFGTAPCCEPI